MERCIKMSCASISKECCAGQTPYSYRLKALFGLAIWVRRTVLQTSLSKCSNFLKNKNHSQMRIDFQTRVAIVFCIWRQFTMYLYPCTHPRSWIVFAYANTITGVFAYANTPRIFLMCNYQLRFRHSLLRMPSAFGVFSRAKSYACMFFVWNGLGVHTVLFTSGRHSDVWVGLSWMLAPKHPNRSLQQRDPLLVMHPGVIFCFPLQEFMRSRQMFLSFLEKYLPTSLPPDFWPFYSHMRIFWPFFARFWVSSLAQYKKAFGQFGPPKI